MASPQLSKPMLKELERQQHQWQLKQEQGETPLPPFSFAHWIYLTRTYNRLDKKEVEAKVKAQRAQKKDQLRKAPTTATTTTATPGASTGSVTEDPQGQTEEEQQQVDWQQMESKALKAKKKKDEEEAARKEMRVQQRKLLHKALITQHLTGSTPTPVPLRKPVQGGQTAVMKVVAQKEEPKQGRPAGGATPKEKTEKETGKGREEKVVEKDKKQGDEPARAAGTKEATSVVAAKPVTLAVSSTPPPHHSQEDGKTIARPLGSAIRDHDASGGASVPTQHTAPLREESDGEFERERDQSQERERSQERAGDKHRWRKENGGSLESAALAAGFGAGSFSTYQQKWQGGRRELDLGETIVRVLQEGAEERRMLMAEARADREFFFRELQAERESARREREALQAEIHQLRMLLVTPKTTQQ